ncbi:MAG: hypothetical protein INR71_06890 [Terriglobus roseus]|nr:hypothetical protein [Terriglobus roseus]
MTTTAVHGEGVPDYGEKGLPGFHDKELGSPIDSTDESGQQPLKRALHDRHMQMIAIGKTQLYTLVVPEVLTML